MKRRNLCLAVIIAASVFAAVSSPVFASTFSLMVSADRPIYSRGNVVVITGSLMNGDTPMPLAPVSVAVLKPSNAMIFVDMPTTNGNGQFSTAFTLPQSTDLGQYVVRVAYQDADAQTTFLVVQTTTTTTTTTSSSSTLSTGTTTNTSSSNTSSTLSTSTDASTTTINTPEFGDWSIIVLSLLLVVTTSQIHRHRGFANGSPT
jgi:hypothetical protein